MNPDLAVCIIINGRTHPFRCHGYHCRYLGHGGGEKYLSRNKIQDLKCRAVALLLGCSSGRLKDNGDFDSTGTPLSYMLAGCPAALGLLWDVTDKDIDRFAQQLLSLWIDEEDAMSLSTATTMSRRVCKFELLTGGAAVVYGIPAYAKKSTEK
ncbi:hypothetical protein SARC_02308 [Sphaeroforma arctica JP610]|uniref:separase n=1 Tax=Sphaeroforma arctica JP610 TaxID=667725 RepID=A0A0L0G901_9EUKA|nr:hypothetical protein SARC_02308 [Sphaeroforma arctica JP610]KNC85507.1 hypothetical protein SARC_02308 [Sphaeroforma arctica JP610]|eukprot:XP_014159409.1 hypothetical protein SARC_02308 [Sphaeroforma arctica JP610]